MTEFDDAFAEGANTQFDAFSFDKPTMEALMVTDENFLEHIRVQGAGVYYYAYLARTKEAEYDDMDRRYKARYAELYDVCSAKIRRTGQKDNQNNILSMIYSSYGDEMEKWHEQLNKLRAERDGAVCYYEGWKAKGFALSSMKDLITAGLIKIDDSITEESMERMSERRRKVEDARSILDKGNVVKDARKALLGEG